MCACVRVCVYQETETETVPKLKYIYITRVDPIPYESRMLFTFCQSLVCDALGMREDCAHIFLTHFLIFFVSTPTLLKHLSHTTIHVLVCFYKIRHFCF